MEKFKGFDANSATITDFDIDTEINNESPNDPELMKIRNVLEQKLPADLINPRDYKLIGNTIIRKEKVMVPNNEQIKKKILESRHDSLLAGHPGRYRTLEQVQRHYYWPNMTKWVNNYVDTCEKCQRTKTALQKQRGELQPLPAPQGPWTDVTYNLIVGLPKTNSGHDAILNMVDRHTKRGHFIATDKTVDAKGTAELFSNHVWKLHGLPLRTISDRGPQFNAQFLKELYSILQIEPNFSTAYHPQTDGQSERVNQYIEQYLHLYTSYQQEDWDRFLALAEFAYNNSENKTIGTTPFFADTGRHPIYTPRRLNPQGKEIPMTKEYIELRQKAEDDIRAAITIAGETSKEFYDRKVEEAPEYQEGQKVWLWLSAYKEDHLGRTTVAPPPVQTAKGEEYEVQEILKSRRTKHAVPRFHYLVSWKGYDASHNSWEPPENVEGAQEVVKELHNKYPNQPRPTQRA